jgi:hypothetical protein
MVDSAILERFANVMRKGETVLQQHVRRHDVGDSVQEGPLAEWHSQSLALLHAVYGDKHPYSTAFVNNTDRQKHFHNGSEAVRAGLGVLKAANEDFSRGYAWTLRDRVHAEVFDDYLQMAESLNREGYKDAAVVIAGSTLEGHLRSLCQKNQIPAETNGKPRKASSLNDDLHKAQVYNQIQWRSIQAWLDLRNDAAHGNYGAYRGEQVALMIDGIRSFVIRHPA